MLDQQTLPFVSLPDPHGVWEKAWRKGELPVEIHSFFECSRRASCGGFSGYWPRSVRQFVRLTMFIRIPRSGSTGIPSPCRNQLGSSVNENKVDTKVRPSGSLVATAFNWRQAPPPGVEKGGFWKNAALICLFAWWDIYIHV